MAARSTLLWLSLSLLCACHPVTVMVAARDLDEGETLQADMVAPASVAADRVTAGGVASQTIDAFYGKALRIQVRHGEPLLATYFREPEPRISVIVQKKGRAVTLSVSGAEGVRANDHVDVLGLVKPPETNEWQATTLLQNVIILRVGSEPPPAAPSQFPLRRVTMMLLPEEAESALLAAQVGALHLALRNPEDLDVREERGRATVSSLLAGEREHGLEQLRLRVLRGPLGPRAPQGREGAPRPGPTTAVAPIPTFQSRK